MADHAEIVISGVRVMDGEREDVELAAVGDYYRRDGRHFVLYEEEEEAGQGAVRNMIKASPDCLEIIKKGDIKSHMVFRQGEKTESSYAISGGGLAVGIHTSRLQVCEREKGLDVHVEYSMEINGQHVSDSSLAIKVKSME